MRWRILKILLAKEVQRHAAQRGGIVLALLLVAASLLGHKATWEGVKGGASWRDLEQGWQADLERLLGCPVDVVTVRGLRERIRARVLAEAVPV